MSDWILIFEVLHDGDGDDARLAGSSTISPLVREGSTTHDVGRAHARDLVRCVSILPRLAITSTVSSPQVGSSLRVCAVLSLEFCIEFFESLWKEPPARTPAKDNDKKQPRRFQQVRSGPRLSAMCARKK